MAQSCRVTVRDDEGENEKERSYTIQMGRRDEKMKRWDQNLITIKRWGCLSGHLRKWLLFRPVSLKWRNDAKIVLTVSFPNFCVCLLCIVICGYMLSWGCVGGRGGRKETGRWIHVTSTFLFIVRGHKRKCFPPEICTSLLTKGMCAWSYLCALYVVKGLIWSSRVKWVDPWPRCVRQS